MNSITNMVFRHRLLACFILVLGILQARAQNVSISPSRLYYKVGLGEYKTQELSVTNNATYSQSFNILFSDFEAEGVAGKSKIMNAGESANSCAEWLSVTPSFFTVEPGQTKKIEILMQVPNSPEANKVKWSAMRIKMVKEKTAPSEADEKAIGLGISETFQFVVHVFQSPPSVTLKNAEIENFSEITYPQDTTRILAMRIKNTGEAILDCASYLEYTNLQTGKNERILPIAFTILPGGTREVKFTLPPNLPKGKYSLLGVVDYGSHENVQAAEMQYEVR